MLSDTHRKDSRVSLAAGITINVVFDIGLIAALCYVMTRPRGLTPHVSSLAAQELTAPRLTLVGDEQDTVPAPSHEAGRLQPQRARVA
jgi:hypothetical protein